ncbi:MAG: 4-hydroxy-tetrahydrodipicolinate synthase [Holosporales bacterium]|jgi:4-hydroxy-tetrahydrodipicolinate synthase|nr:4-hydroxy-tetrahydrodipicolinate synthase [Holosporales bacterium]
MKISGSIVALVTPLNNDKIDCQALQGLVRWHHVQGTDGIVVVGSTGEGGLLSADERAEAIHAAVAQNNTLAKQMKIIAGCGTLSTRDTINMVQIAEKCGADAIMVVSPPYIKPTQAGLLAHFKAVAESVSVPVVIYNHPGRTGINIQNETLVDICNESKNVIAIKDSNPDLSRIARLRKALPSNVSLLSGDDATNIGFMAQGGDGIISVTANVFPSLCKKFVDAWNRGDIQEANTIHQKLMPVHDVMFCEPNPGPAIYATAKLRGFSNELRSPLFPVQGSSAKKIDEAISQV